MMLKGKKALSEINDPKTPLRASNDVISARRGRRHNSIRVIGYSTSRVRPLPPFFFSPCFPCFDPVSVLATYLCHGPDFPHPHRSVSLFGLMVITNLFFHPATIKNSTFPLKGRVEILVHVDELHMHVMVLALRDHKRIEDRAFLLKCFAESRIRVCVYIRTVKVECS